MPKVTGIGGVFIFSNDPKALADWYARHFGFELMHEAQAGNYYGVLWSRDLNNPEIKLQTVFAIMPAPETLGPTRGEYMINYRVEDLDGLVTQLQAAGVGVAAATIQDDGQGGGKFTQLKDPEGNRIELWEHIMQGST